MQLAQTRQDLLPDQTALRIAIGLVGPELQPFGTAVLLRLLAPDGEQRAHDAVLAARLDPLRHAARDEPVEDGLDLVGGGVPGGAETVGRERVPDLAPVVLGAPAAAVDHLRAEPLGAEARILVGGVTPQPVIHVQRGDAIAELRQDVPETGRVGAARDEAGHVAARRDQVVPADQLLDPRAQRSLSTRTG